jgi:D-tagatose-1,6-bisphosphate aldolase subunit GatZ/KbaZ
LTRKITSRIQFRCCWPTPGAQHATKTLLDVLGDTVIPRPLISQYLGQLDSEVAAGHVKPVAHELLIGNVTRILDICANASGQ